MLLPLRSLGLILCFCDRYTFPFSEFAYQMSYFITKVAYFCFLSQMAVLDPDLVLPCKFRFNAPLFLHVLHLLKLTFSMFNAFFSAADAIKAGFRFCKIFPPLNIRNIVGFDCHTNRFRATSLVASSFPGQICERLPS